METSNEPHSSLSAGVALYSVLKDVLGAGNVRPVLSETDVQLPLVTFRRLDVRSVAVKGRADLDEVTYELVVFAASYGDGVRTMERVRDKLTARIVATEEDDGFALTMDCVRTEGGEESWKDGAFVQTLRLAYRVTLPPPRKKDRYELTLKSGTGTIILPFGGSVPEGLTLYECSRVKAGNSLDLVRAARLDANTPYIVQGAAGTYTFEGYGVPHDEVYTKGLLTGFLADGHNAPRGSYVFTSSGMQRLSKDVALPAHRCYVSIP